MGFLHYLGKQRANSNYMACFLLELKISIAIEKARSVCYCTLSTSVNFDIIERINSFNAPDRYGEMLESNVVKWTSMISMNARKGFNDRALACFLQMQRVGVEPNETTFSTAIGVCRELRRVDTGMSLHSLILKKGGLRELFVASGLITMYSKCDCLEEARKVFDEMLEKDAVSWNSMISAYSQKDLNKEALSLFFLMLNTGNDLKLLVNNFTLASIFKACAGLSYIRFGISVHSYSIKLGFDSDVFVCGSTIDMYSKCGSLDIARHIFDQMEKRDLVVWNTMITGYAQNDYGEEAVGLFYQLQSEGILPNETTFSCILKASAMMSDSSVGRCFHAKTFKCGSLSDVFVGTALVDMYSKYYDMEDAERAFGEMAKKNLVSFNALITGYSLTGMYEEALRVYVELHTKNMRPDTFTFTGLFSSCSVLGAFAEGSQVHAHSIIFGLDSSVLVGNSLVNFYGKCGLMDSASKAFESIPTPNAISWAGIISGFAQNGEGEKALKYFCKLHKFSGRTDEFSFTSVLKALANWATVEQGRHLHAHVIKTGLELTIFVGSALVDMYSKYGIAEDSFKVFTEMPEKNVVSWNSMITGYAQNGFSEKSLLLFEEMTNSDVIPTCITFIGILFACSHAGFVQEGRHCYNLMIFKYGIPPSVEHCTCMVDLLGRAGYLHEAENFLLNSPFPSEPGIWKSLLAACGVHKNVDVAVRAARHCLLLEPQDSATYVILSNIYASKQLWCEVSRIRNLMKEMGVEKEPGRSWIEVNRTRELFKEMVIKKQPGCSWIDVTNMVHDFVAEETSCPPEEIVAALQSLVVHSEMDGYDLDHNIYAP
ncbi:hypothetical protein HHK36_021667 [Tetracentron sinense]|uniref:Pentatricopeptide repeat-containing protein n=1 Tax=Tetracentron sinense TaxID=13715 RepID=A0A835D7A2_TETSI|nr:hypothetical protein HHK36_021667 [Tetracentron sinense]